MSKLRLQLEDLSVESFDATPAARERGTVVGQQCTCFTNCTCNHIATCPVTCYYTCDDYTCETCEGPSCVQCGSAEDSCTCP